MDACVPGRIRDSYLRGMFIIDLAASLPMQYLDCINGVDAPWIKIVRLLRLVCVCVFVCVCAGLCPCLCDARTDFTCGLAPWLPPVGRLSRQ